MEMSQRNSLYSYLKQKCHSFAKTRKREWNRSGSWGGGGESVWEGKMEK
jgi:hypothetical protein